MTTTTSSKTAPIVAALSASGGVVNVVDQLLKACIEHRLMLKWDARGLRIKPLSKRHRQVESVDLQLPTSHFRAVLARVAVLCNDTLQQSLSPYGGRGVIRTTACFPNYVHVEMTNTADVQSLLLRPTSRSDARQLELLLGIALRLAPSTEALRTPNWKSNAESSVPPTMPSFAEYTEQINAVLATLPPSPWASTEEAMADLRGGE